MGLCLVSSDREKASAEPGAALKCVFVARPNAFSAFLADWLAQRTHLQAVISADTDRETWGWRYRWFIRSRKRYGLVSSLDRALFRAWCLRSREMKEGWRTMIADIKRSCPVPPAQPAERLAVSSINAPEVEALLARLQPDLLFTNCIAERMAPRIFEQPTWGTLVYREGVTPEYRGVHSVFWALANGDDDKVGYCLLKADDQLDSGHVYAQGSIRIDPLANPMGYVGHWALYEGLPDVDRVLRDLQHGRAMPLPPRPGLDRYFSYFPLSGLLRIRRRRAARGLRWLVTRPTSR